MMKILQFVGVNFLKQTMYVKSCSSTRNNIDSGQWSENGRNIFTFFYTGLWETSKAFSHHNKSCITVFDLRLEVKNQDILGIYFDIL